MIYNEVVITDIDLIEIEIKRVSFLLGVQNIDYADFGSKERLYLLCGLAEDISYDIPINIVNKTRQVNIWISYNNQLTISHVKDIVDEAKKHFDEHVLFVLGYYIDDYLEDLTVSIFLLGEEKGVM